MNTQRNSSNLRSLTGVHSFSTRELETLSALARKGAFEICLAADHGHIGGSSAATELFVALYFGGVLRFNPGDPHDARRDRVLVRGHLGPLRYKIFSWLGWIEEDELPTYRRLGTRLHGHEDHLETPGVDISPSGSLGMLLSYGTGAALGMRDTGRDSRTFVFLGDGEEQEGVVSEAARHAAHLKLGNLVAIIDRNGKQLSNPVVDTDSTNLALMWEGYGWRVLHVPDGHNIKTIVAAYTEAVKQALPEGRPMLIIADTVKGIGLEGATEHFSGFHTMSRVRSDVVRCGVAAIDAGLDAEEVRAVLEKVNALRVGSQVDSEPVASWQPVPLGICQMPQTPNHPDDCQFDYFSQLRRLTEKEVLDPGGMYFLTADVTTKEAVQKLGLGDMFRFHNVGIREQHMIALSHGLSTVRPDARILINSFDAFTYRCIDQINALLQGHGSIVIIGDVSGVTNARNGKTHQTTGLPAALLSMEGLTFLEPWDAADTFACLNWAIGQSRRAVYIRVHSSFVQCLPDERVERSLSYYSVRDTAGTPDLVLVSSGLTVDSCIKAADRLKEEGVSVRVVNVVNPNSLDAGFGRLVAGGRPCLTVYNGHPRVLRQSVADALLQYSIYPSVVQGIGFTVGNTGTLPELLAWAGLDGEGVHATALGLL